MRTRLVFVRHAEAEGNINREFHGWTDSGITEKGRMQAQMMAQRLKNIDIDVLYSSTLKRTLETAGYISKIKNLPIIRTDKMKEINGGEWEGRRWDELPKLWPEEYDAWETKPHLLQMPKGESMTGFQKRLITEVIDIIEKNKGKNICIVTHGTAIKALMCSFTGCSLEQMNNIAWYDNTSVTIIDYDGESFSSVMEGDASHLSKEWSTMRNQDWWAEYSDKLEKSKVRFDMDKYGKKLITLLFETKALRVSPEDKPFWYTSGSIGPYYINTHFLYGSEEKADKLLKVIDTERTNRLECPLRLNSLVRENYYADDTYRYVIDSLCSYIKENINLEEVAYISGGERRDWFFSLLAAEFLGKPHITIFKDSSAVITEEGITKEAGSIQGKKVLHIADLITEASSYERAWIPAIGRIDGKMAWSVVIVDRNQGGGQYLEGQGISSNAMVHIDKALFNEALKQSLINIEQFEMISSFIDDPKESMKNFLKKNPGFLEASLKADEKTRQRATMCLEKNIYEL